MTVVDDCTNVFRFPDPLVLAGVPPHGSLRYPAHERKTTNGDTGSLTIVRNIHKPIINTNVKQMQVKNNKYILELIARMKKHMAEHDLKPADLSRGCGLPQPTIMRILTRKSPNPHQTTVDRIEQYMSSSTIKSETPPPERRAQIVERLYELVNEIRSDVWKLRDRIDALEHRLGELNAAGFQGRRTR